MTVNEQDAVFKAASVAVQLTVVAPIGTQDPEGGVHTTVTPGQLSVAVAVKVAVPQGAPGGVITVTPAGQVIVGACVSFTVIVNEQVLPLGTLQDTVVVPTGKKEPDAGVHVTTPQAPEVVGAGYVTTAPH